MIELLIMIALIGLGAWLLVTYVPMPAAIRTVIIVVAVIGCILYALRAFGGLPAMGVPHIR